MPDSEELPGAKNFKVKTPPLESEVAFFAI
jgi:hypothetical protein